MLARIWVTLTILLITGATWLTSTNLMAELGRSDANHAAPHQLTLDGENTGVWALAGIVGSDTPAAGTWTRAMDAIGVGMPEARQDQRRARTYAWKAVQGYADVTYNAPKLAGPTTWKGTSAGLAYAIAYAQHVLKVDLLDGRQVAATGTVDVYGEVGPVMLLRAKAGAAVEAGADIMFTPEITSDEARQAGREISQFLTDVKSNMEVVPVGSIDEAVAYLCSTSTRCTFDDLPTHPFSVAPPSTSRPPSVPGHGPVT